MKNSSKENIRKDDLKEELLRKLKPIEIKKKSAKTEEKKAEQKKPEEKPKAEEKKPETQKINWKSKEFKDFSAWESEEFRQQKMGFTGARQGLEQSAGRAIMQRAEEEKDDISYSAKGAYGQTSYSGAKDYMAQKSYTASMDTAQGTRPAGMGMGVQSDSSMGMPVRKTERKSDGYGETGGLESFAAEEAMRKSREEEARKKKLPFQQ